MELGHLGPGACGGRVRTVGRWAYRVKRCTQQLSNRPAPVEGNAMRRLSWLRFLTLWAITTGTIAMAGLLIPRLGIRSTAAAWVGGIVVWFVATGVFALLHDRPRS